MSCHITRLGSVCNWELPLVGRLGYHLGGETTLESDRATRRTGAVRTSGRAARVVEQVLVATASELSRVGFAALRVDDVAARSGVNKTTIYRRWPTRADLVAAAIRHQKPPIVHGEGSLRDDLRALAHAFVGFHASPIGRGIVRVMQTEVGHPELEPVVRAIRAESRAARAELVRAAIARGELPPKTDAGLVADMIFATVLLRLVTFDEPVDDALLDRIIDLVMLGARALAE